MRALLNIILVLSVLISQSVWAVHGVELDGGGNPEQTYAQPVGQHDEVTGTYNHYCHASAHLVGLFSTNTIELQTSGGGHQATLQNLTSSLNYQPPIPPPIF